MGDIKEYRKYELRDFVLVNVLLMLYFSGTLNIFFDSFGLEEVSNGALHMIGALFGNAFIATAVYIYVFIFDTLLTGNTKFKVAYCFKRDRAGLPAETIFSELISGDLSDSRFTVADLQKTYDDVISNLNENNYSKKERYRYENACWYKIYAKYEKTEQKLWVSQKDFLLCRDMTMACLFLSVLYIIICILINEMKFSLAFAILMVIEAVLCDVAMRSKGKKFAVDVIATDIARKYQNDVGDSRKSE